MHTHCFGSKFESCSWDPRPCISLIRPPGAGAAGRRRTIATVTLAQPKHTGKRDTSTPLAIQPSTVHARTQVFHGQRIRTASGKNADGEVEEAESTITQRTHRSAARALAWPSPPNRRANNTHYCSTLLTVHSCCGHARRTTLILSQTVNYHAFRLS